MINICTSYTTESAVTTEASLFLRAFSYLATIAILNHWSKIHKLDKKYETFTC